MRVLITGASGQLGSEFLEVLKGENVLALSHSELDITDFGKLKKVFVNFRPEILINTAAYHLVDECEDFPEKAFLVNSIAVRNLALLSEKPKTVLINFSTDYVFDGKRKNPYNEDDPPYPLSVYGLSKLCGEIFIKNNCERFYIIRTCGLYGSKGKSSKGGNFIDRIISRWIEGKEINVVSDQIVTPTYAKELAEKVILLIKKKAPFGIYHMTNEGECSWYEFTKKVFEILGVNAEIKPVLTDELNLKAKRPKYSVLENNKMREVNIPDFRHWSDALKEYLEEKYGK
ncbi:MAG: dTDP-4-dehydrorhamnose reductase [Candidatus Aminicenantia bacterium]